MSGREQSLETLRGFAALSVLFWHITLGFFPARSGIFANFPAEKALNGSPIYGLINGSASVVFFFVLSGFVLTRRFFLDGNPTFLLRNSVKRWPRLALPVTSVVLISFALFHLDLYRFEAAAELTRSPWLSKFAYAYEVPFKPHFADALNQGLFRTFFFGDSYYDSSLWTMRIEFIGSFIAFGLAAVVGVRSHIMIRLLLVAIVIVLIKANAPLWYVGFPIGVFIASVLPERSNTLPLSASMSGLVIALYLAGYSMTDRGVFHPIVLIFGQIQSTYIWTAAAALVIVATLLNERMRALLGNRMGQFVGWISFPLYLVHVPVLCSAGCAMLLWTTPYLPTPWPCVAAALTTIVVSILISIPIALINDLWVRILNFAVRAMTDQEHWRHGIALGDNLRERAAIKWIVGPWHRDVR